MIRKRLFTVVLAVATFTLSPLVRAADAKDALDAFHAALVAGDRAKALELLAPEVVIYESGYVERSRDEYAANHLGADMEFAKTATRKVLKQSERVSGNTTIIWEETETTGASHGKPVQASGLETVVLEKRGDAWAIVHIHWSSRKGKLGK